VLFVYDENFIPPGIGFGYEQTSMACLNELIGSWMMGFASKKGEYPQVQTGDFWIVFRICNGFAIGLFECSVNDYALAFVVFEEGCEDVAFFRRDGDHIELIVYLLILVGVVYAVITIVWYTIRNGISPMPTGLRVQRAIFDVLQNIDPDGVVVELGSGWGTLASGIARRFPSCRVTAFENSPVPYLFSQFSQCVMPVTNLVIERRDFYGISLTDADVVICYLYSGAMERLREKFERELRSGTWVISHTFAVPAWTPNEVVEARDLYHTKVYIYRV